LPLQYNIFMENIFINGVIDFYELFDIGKINGYVINVIKFKFSYDSLDF